MTSDPASDPIGAEMERRRAARETAQLMADALAATSATSATSPVCSREYLEELCRQRNAACRRAGVMWIVDCGEIRMVDDLEASRLRTERINDEVERERHDWKRRNGHAPIPAAPHWTDDRHDD